MTTKYNQYPYCKPANDAAYRTNASSHEPIHSKQRINWFTLGSWLVMLIMCIAFWAAIISLFMSRHHGAMCTSRHLVYSLHSNRRMIW